MAVILSISSQVVRGHVGNSAAGFALARLGHEVWPLPTVILAHHPGHDRGAPRLAMPAETLAEVVAGLARRGWLAEIDAVLVGYLAGAGQAGPVAAAIAAIREVRPDALVAVDPVIGDEGRLYVAADLAAAVRDAVVPAADIVTPNAFELGWLAGRPVRTVDETVAAARAIGAPEVLVTSAPASREGAAATLVVAGDGVWAAETERLDHAAHGAGDLMAGLYLGRRLLWDPPRLALGRAVGAVFAVLAETARRGRDELALAAAGDRLAARRGARVARLA